MSPHQAHNAGPGLSGRRTRCILHAWRPRHLPRPGLSGGRLIHLHTATSTPGPPARSAGDNMPNKVALATGAPTGEPAAAQIVFLQYFSYAARRSCSLTPRAASGSSADPRPCNTARAAARPSGEDAWPKGRRHQAGLGTRPPASAGCGVNGPRRPAIWQDAVGQGRRSFSYSVGQRS